MTEEYISILCRYEEEPLIDLWQYKSWYGPEKVYLVNGFKLVEDQGGEKGYIIHDLDGLYRVLDRLSADRTIETHASGKWVGWKTIKITMKVKND